MSLVITSNVSLDDRPETSEVFKPYSYQNPLLNTMRIPANSEIALQSAKINKNGVASLTAANSNFNHYFGVEVGTALCPTIENSTQIPFSAVIGAGQLFRQGGRAERNIDDLTIDLSDGINAAAFNPSLINAAVPTSIAVTQNRVTATKALEGFKFTSTQGKAIVKKATSTAVWTDISVNKRGGFTQNAGVVTSTTTTGFHVQAKQYPIAQAKGSVFFDITKLNKAQPISPFVVGLSRINRRITNNTGVSREAPEYWNPNAQKAGARLPRVGGQIIYGDIMVGRSGTELCVWQSGVDSAGRLDGTKMNEIVYYGGNFNATFKSGKYNLQTNASKYEKVKFTLDNENMRVDLIDENNAVVLLADFTITLSKGGEKENLTAPICAPKMAMYPIMAGRGATGTTGEFDELFHYTNYPTWAEETYANYDWWGYSQKNNLTQWCLEVESRFWNDFGDDKSGINSDGLQIPVLSAAGGELVGYQSFIITAPSLEYGQSKTFSDPAAHGAGITGNATASRLMGFLNTPVSIPASVGGVTTNNSVSVPILSSDASLFIRLNNFTQKTVNARQGTGSKIIAHLPRFDNSGKDLGGLYFEPNTPTYLSLGNTDDLLINSFDIDFVYDNETLCTALSGKTVVCLHIRDKLK